MKLVEFSDKWISENVSDEFYPDMKEDVRAFVFLYIRQRHSGSSSHLFFMYIFKLFEDYYKQFEKKS